MTGIALTRDEKIHSFILREPLQPVDQKSVGVDCGGGIPRIVVVRGCIRIRKAHTSGRFKEDHDCHCILHAIICLRLII